VGCKRQGMGRATQVLRRRCHEWTSETKSCCSIWRTAWHDVAESGSESSPMASTQKAFAERRETFS
jgi:hypothetical protein